MANDSGVWGEDPIDEDDPVVVRSTDISINGSWAPSQPARRHLTSVERYHGALRADDLVVVKSSGSEAHLGKTALVTQEVARLEACFSNFVQRLRLRPSLYPRYGWYLLNSSWARSQLGYLGTTTTGLQNLSASVLSSFMTPGAPLGEQHAIADFLDRKTARIDALIVAKRRMIELLEERRQAFINNAVTHGMQSHVETSTGNLFAPSIPVGWRLVDLKHVVNRIVDTAHKTAPDVEEGEYLVVRTANVKNGRLILDDAKYTDAAGFAEWTVRGIPKPGDILFTREAPAGEACLVPDRPPLCIGQRMVLIQVHQSKMLGEFGLYSLYGGAAQEFVKLLERSTTVPHLNMSDIPNIPIVLPPLDEQLDIINSIRTEVGRLDSLASTLIQQLALLDEHRQTLITAGVTGALSIPGVAL